MKVLTMKMISLIVCLGVVTGTGLMLAVPSAAAENFELVFEPGGNVGIRADPDPPLQYPYHLIIDDDQADGAFGVTLNGAAHQFMWFNRFTPPVSPFLLNEVWVLFPSGSNMTAGAEIEIFIYLDPDGDPSNGADLVTSLTDVVQAVDGNTFSVYPLPSPLYLGSGDVLVGVVNRFVESGVTSPTLSAAIDTTTSEGRSWIAVWTGDPTSAPMLPADALYGVIDDYQPGNWMIRAFGSDVPELVPVLDTWGAVGLILMISAIGLCILRRIN